MTSELEVGLYIFMLAAGYGAGRYWVVGAVATLLFFASVVIHELSHALVGNRLGQEVRRITLFIFGGMAHLSGDREAPRSSWRSPSLGR